MVVYVLIFLKFIVSSLPLCLFIVCVCVAYDRRAEQRAIFFTFVLSRFLLLFQCSITFLFFLFSSFRPSSFSSFFPKWCAATKICLMFSWFWVLLSFCYLCLVCLCVCILSEIIFIIFQYIDSFLLLFLLCFLHALLFPCTQAKTMHYYYNYHYYYYFYHY